MSNTAEVIYAIENDRPSITIRLSAQEEGETKPDLCGMLSQIQEATNDFYRLSVMDGLFLPHFSACCDLPHIRLSCCPSFFVLVVVFAVLTPIGAGIVSKS